MFYQERYVNMQDKSIATAYASDEGTEGKIIPLRPHHGMCLAYFKGEGYSGGFTAHMAEMLKLFLSGEGRHSRFFIFPCRKNGNFKQDYIITE